MVREIFPWTYQTVSLLPDHSYTYSLGCSGSCLHLSASWQQQPSLRTEKKGINNSLLWYAYDTDIPLCENPLNKKPVDLPVNKSTGIQKAWSNNPGFPLPRSAAERFNLIWLMRPPNATHILSIQRPWEELEHTSLLLYIISFLPSLPAPEDASI